MAFAVALASEIGPGFRSCRRTQIFALPEGAWGFNPTNRASRSSGFQPRAVSSKCPSRLFSTPFSPDIQSFPRAISSHARDSIRFGYRAQPDRLPPPIKGSPSVAKTIILRSQCRRLRPTTRARVQEEAMKILRSVNRRSFNVEPAGYFNVLMPSKRFTTSHPPGQFRYLTGQSRGTVFSRAHENPAAAPPFQLISMPHRNDPGYRRLLRPASIALAATALTLFLVWWSAGCPLHIIFWTPPQ